MVRRRVLSAILLCAALPLRAGEAPAPAPAGPTVVGFLTSPDFARTRARWLQGPYGRIWALPAMASARAGVDEGCAKVLGDYGIDPRLVLADIASDDILFAVAADGSFVSSEQVRLPTQIGPVMAAIAAHGAAAVGAPPSLGGRTCRMDGERLVLEQGPAAPLGVARPAPLDPGSDSSGRVDFAAWARAAGADGEEAGKALANLGLTTLLMRETLGPAGMHDEVEMPGFDPVMVPLDPAALAALPEHPLLLLAGGIDGERLAPALTRLLAWLPPKSGLVDADRTLAAQHLPPLAGILGATRGTAWLAVLPGAPFPHVTLAVPASPALDQVLDAVAAKLGVDLAAARGTGIPLPLPPGLPLLVQVRRTATHWLVGSDAALLDTAAAAQAGGFALPATTPGASGAPLGLFSLDTRGAAQLALAYLPFVSQALAGSVATAERGTQRRVLALVQQGLAAAAPLLPPCSGVLSKGPSGATIVGDNFLGPALVVAGAVLPVVGMVRALNNQQKSGKNLSQLAGAIIAYQTSEDKNPKALAEVVAAEHLPAALLVSPSAPGIADPYLYIRSVEDVSAAVPLLIEDPACNKGRGTMVCFGDSHTKFIKGPAALRLWAEAKRLAASPKAAAGGIALEDWAAVFDVLGVDPADVGPAEPTPAAKPEAAPIP